MTPTSSLARNAPRNGAAPPTVKRVGIYCRQSVDRGDEYGSTDAQREAISAYVASQRSLGWIAVETRYDDRGESGSTLDRPAFQRLLQDVDAGDVDIVAVYKIDRLSRSLLDFTQLMRRFEEKGVEFVSVTQQFSTSTSVGRMTLNLLATFAQFERETISERTRDKIAATRRRGLWTGGRPVLGYDVVDRRLVVNADEAEQVRAIFRLYLECGSLMAVVEELGRRSWHNKTWMNQRGQLVTGSRFDKSSLRHLLTNPIYLGQLTLGAERHAGAHPAIVELEVFDSVQAQMQKHGREGNSETRNRWGALLRGLLRCSVCGKAMTHSYASRGTKRYGFYVCSTAQKSGAAACPGSRVSLGQIEDFVIDRVRAIGRDPDIVAATIAAARREWDDKKSTLAADLRRLDLDGHRRATERAILSAAAGGGATPDLTQRRLAKVDELLAQIATRRDELRAELVLVEKGHLDEADLRTALAGFDQVWAELLPRERARVIRLLIEEVRFDGRTGDVSVTLHPQGVRFLANQKRSATE